MRAAATSNLSRLASSVSIIGLPTKWIRCGATPSLPRCATASALVAKSRSESRSVTRRLTSSGIEGSKLRSPASTWASGICSLAATSAAATVELTSP